MQVNEIASKIGELTSQSSVTRQDTFQGGSSPSKKGVSSTSVQPEVSWESNDVKGIVGALQEALSRVNERIVFSLHKETGEVVVKVIDPRTNKVIRQIPPEELIKLREKLDELIGILFEAKA